ncbi:SBBP repeat-containing protein [Nitrosococcus watsonii]|uniref:DUF7948 domain-containing protein n=1 Tax=Nitrosococcus watsoni (strain C-113) TaxID=105559 RepID=D8K527_NITWC|nr:SBBP repeat-containing protein [Nitrosococcus watsonii]ADJ28004.1 conserved hypothetical protein [Nitrosococcus watsonii C-113]
MDAQEEDFSLFEIVLLMKEALITAVVIVWLGSATAAPLDDSPASGLVDERPAENIPSALTQASIASTYGQMPLSFELNQGQTDSAVKFFARGAGYQLFLTATEAVLALQQLAGESVHKSVKNPNSVFLRMQLLEANAMPQVSSLEMLPGKVNYFRGKDQTQWRTGIPTYAKVKYESVYPGIDLVYYGNPRQLEYDFIVAPGADPKTIRLAFQGADKLEVNAQGDLVIETTGGPVRFKKPLIYQAIGGNRQKVAGRYVLGESHQVKFEVAAYDTDKPLIIDPVLSYSTYLGGKELVDIGSSIAADAEGHAYVTGWTSSVSFPVLNAAQPQPSHANNGSSDAFIAKLSSDSHLVYVTYLGGCCDERGRGIAVDLEGNAYITGWTSSFDFPTFNPLQPNCFLDQQFGACLAAFVTKLGADGAMVYSTFLGGDGNDDARDIAVDTKGQAYITGTTASTNFPLVNGLQTALRNFDVFVTKLNAEGSRILYSTYLGGSDIAGSSREPFFSSEGVGGIAVDGEENAYVTGWTNAIDFPLINGFQGTTASSRDAFMAKIDTTVAGAASLVYSTLLGGAAGADYAIGIAVDAVGQAYILGQTLAHDFPTKNALQPDFAGGGTLLFPNFPSDAFVAKIDPSRVGEDSLVYATYLGGSESEGVFPSFKLGDIAVNRWGQAYITGSTMSLDFPTIHPLQASCALRSDGFCRDSFVSKLSADGSALLFSTYWGGSSADFGTGIALSGEGGIYITGVTRSSDFPILNPLQPALAGSMDVFVTKILDTRLLDCPAGVFSPIIGSNFYGAIFADGGSILTGNPLTLILNSLKSDTTFGPLTAILGDLFPCPLSGVKVGRKVSNRLSKAEN